MGRTESSAAWLGKNSPAAGSRSEVEDFEEFEDFELEELAAAYGARLPGSLSFDGEDDTRGDRATISAVSKL
jgi:hypothetical protein